MAPHEINELREIIEMVNAPYLRDQDRMFSELRELRSAIDRVQGEYLKQEERIKSVEDDTQKISDKLDALEKNIIKNQQRRFGQVIATQASLIFLIIAGFIAYIFSLPPFHR